MRSSRFLSVLGIGIGVLAATIWILWPPPENVILITIDTMRADHISAYGYEKHRTPNLDRLADEGALFENAFCDVTWTIPSMTSVMTGLYASKHGLRSSYQTLGAEATTLAEMLHDRGYQTAAIVASYPLHSIFGLNQGFDPYDETFSSPLLIDPELAAGPPEAKSTPDVAASNQMKAVGKFLVGLALDEAYRPDSEVSDRAIKWLGRERRRRKPFFLWVHYFGPHEKPSGLTNVYEEREAQLAAYDPDVVTTDAEIGRVLAALDELALSKATTVILHADHGQSLTEHNYFGHGRNVFDPTEHIPLMIRSPRHVPARQRVGSLVRNIDLMPTILDLLKIPAPPGLDGRSLLPRIAEGATAAWTETDGTYVETYLSATWLFADVVGEGPTDRVPFRRLGYRTREWKYVINDPVPFVDRDLPLAEETRRQYYTDALYDLTADPGETVNVVEQHPELRQRFLKEIWTQQRHETLAQPIVLDDPTRNRLKALGYIGD